MNGFWNLLEIGISFLFWQSNFTTWLPVFIYKWKRAALSDGNGTSSGKELAEIEALKKRNRELEQEEVEILKNVWGWQPKGETVGITPQSNRKTNIFGIFSSDNRSFTKSSEQNINSQSVVAAIDEFCQHIQIDRPTVLVLDNASPHHSRLFKSNQEKWETQGPYIFYLPKYSPHLKIAETLRRKAKYEWIKSADYLSFERFKQKVTDIFTHIEAIYQINFEERKCQPNSAWLLNTF